MGGFFSKIPVKTLSKVVPVAVPAVKVLQLALTALAYKKTALQPFSRCIFQYGALGAIAKILFFWHDKVGLNFSDGTKTFLQDMSFVFPLVGVVITMGLDFLWALSSSSESSKIFNRNTSESDFVLNWYKTQLPLIVGLASIRHLPVPVNGQVLFEGAIDTVLIGSFGFIWYCLHKVRGSSDTKKFKDAYNAAFAITALCTNLVATNVVMGGKLLTDPEGFKEAFILVEHCLETTGIFGMFSYFAYIKAPPADLHDHVNSMDTVGTVVKAKGAFKRALGLNCKDSVVKKDK